MVDSTIAITRQVGGTCYAHSVTRSVFRLLRVYEVTKDPQVFDRILDWTIAKFGKDGGDCTTSMEELLLRESSPPTFPAEMKQYLQLREYQVVHGSGGTTRSKVGNVMKIKCFSSDGSLPRDLQEALKGNREPIFWFCLFKNQFDVVERHNFDASSMEGTHIPDSKVGQLKCHAVVLTKSDGTGIEFKNSWGERWGYCGSFKLRSLVPFFKGRGYVHFLDVTFDENLPEIYRRRVARFNDRNHFQRLRQIPFEDLRLQQRIGEGRSSRVHKGEFNGQALAIKVTSCPQDEFFRLRELKYLMDHKNIVKLKFFAFRYHETPNHERMYDLRIAMALEQHGSLTDFCASLRGNVNPSLNKRALMAGGVVGWTHFFNIALDLAEALHYLLANGFVHGDICSDNILIGDEYVAKLGDLGTVSSMHTLTAQELGGHAGWMSPELLSELGGGPRRSGRVLTHKSDVFGFGRVLEYMLNPCRGNDASEVDPCLQLRDKIPKTISDIILPCLKSNPLTRPDAGRLMTLIGLAYRANECRPPPRVIPDRFEGLVIHHGMENEIEDHGETEALRTSPVIEVEVSPYFCRTIEELLEQLKAAAVANDAGAFKACLRVNIFPNNEVAVLDVGGRISTLLNQRNIIDLRLEEVSLTNEIMSGLCREVETLVVNPTTHRRRRKRVSHCRSTTPTLVPPVGAGFAGGLLTNQVLLDQEPPPRPSASSSKKEVEEYFLHCVKHRLELKIIGNGGDSSAHVVGGPRKNARAILSQSSQVDQEPMIEVVQRILSTADPIVREYLFSALLERRYTVPLFLFSDTKPPFSLLNDLLLTRTHVGDGVVRCLVADVTLPRIAIVETIPRPSGEMETQILMRECFGVHSLGGRGSLQFIESGFGFFGNEGNRKKCLVLHLKGCYELFKEALVAVVDVIVIHTSGEWLRSHPNPSVFSPPEGSEIPLFLYWQVDNVPLPADFGEENAVDASSVHDEHLRRCVTSMLGEPPGAAPRLPLIRMVEGSNAVSDSFRLSAAADLKVAMILQERFRRQAELQRRLRSEYLTDRRQILTASVANEVNTRRELVGKREYRSRLGSLQEFLAVLSTADPCRRIESFIRFSQELAAKVDEALGPLKERRRVLVSRRMEESDEVKSLIRDLELEYSSKLVSTEHLWRELGCIYATDAIAFSSYPDLAAAHLLDGFPLELVDGDSSKVNNTWFEQVITSLESKIVKNAVGNGEGWKPSITVLSILGCQSSGKSTMLNLMFGCRLRTSIERCTKGINMQLIPSTRQGNEYVLVLDVEGVRAPEFSNHPDYKLHDNRLGVFAVWCADVTLVLMNNTHAGDMQQILSLVTYLSERASVTEQAGENGCSELVFAMRSVQINADPEARRRLKEDLCRQMEAARATPNLLMTFDPEEDVFILGNLFGGDIPPADTPLSSYGEGCLKLRERLHAKAIHHRRFGSFASWKTRVVQVGNIVQRLENKMRVLSASEIERRESIDAYVGERIVIVCRAYQEKLEAFDTEFAEYVDKALQRIDVDDSPELLVLVIVQMLTTELEDIQQQQLELLKQYFAGHAELLEFEQDSLDKWTMFLQKERNRCERIVKDLVNSRHLIEEQLNNAKIRLTEAVHRLCRETVVGDRKKWTEEQRNQKFESIFSRVLEEQPYDAPEKTIPDRVKSLYVRSNKVSMSDSGDGVDDAEAPVRHVNMISSMLVASLSWAGKVLSSIMPRFRRASDDGMEETVVLSLLEGINESIQMDMLKEQIYSDTSIQKAIDITESFLSNFSTTRGITLSFDIKDTVHKEVMAMLIFLWVEKQTIWENENNVRSKLQQSKKELKVYFEGMVLGSNELDLLVEAVRSHLECHLIDAYKEQLKRTILIQIRDADSGFVRCAKKLQAEVDLDLLNNFDDEAYLKRALRDPKEHYINVQKSIILNDFSSCLNDTETWRNLLNSIKRAVRRAVEAASSVDEHRAGAFFRSLHRNLNCAKLSDGLVSAADAAKRYKNLDSQNSSLISGIANKIIQSLPDPNCPAFGNSLAEKQFIASSVFDSLRDCDIYPELKLRCNACCPRCGVQCTHPMGRGHEGPHETFHQPEGINGARRQGTNILWSKSCVQSAAEGTLMVLGEGNSLPYSQFSTRFPDWKNPGDSVYPLRVRELIFRFKQPMLHEMYLDTQPCPNDEMRAFEHGGVEQARREIREQLNTIY